MPIIDSIAANLWRRIKSTVAAETTVVVEATPLALFGARKYLVHVSNATQGKYKSVEVWASRKGSEVNESVYAKLGDALDVSLNWFVVGPDIQLQITNDEAFSVDVVVTKLV